MRKARQLLAESSTASGKSVGNAKSINSESGKSVGKTKFKALQDAFNIINNLREDNISVEEMRFDLTKMGVSLSEQEFQGVLKRAGVTKDGKVNFNSFMTALGKTRRFAEFSMLKDAIQAIDKIEGDKVVLHELPSFMKSMGIHLSDKDFQEALKQVSVDENGKIFVKDFIKTLTNSPHFSELSVLKDTIQAVSHIQSNKVSLQDLRPTLKKMGIRLNAQEYEELIKTTPIDNEGKLDIGNIMKKISKSQRYSEMEVLKSAVKAFSQLKDNKLNFSDVEPYLISIGVHLTKPELGEVIKSLPVSPDGTVDVNNLISAMKATRRFTNYSAVHDAIHALKLIKDHRGPVLKRDRSSLDLFGLQFANQVITQVLKSANVTEAGQTKFNEFLRTLTRNPKFRTSGELLDGFAIISKLENDRIGVKELQVVMKNFNITLPPEEVSEALTFCSIDANNKVNLKDFLRGVTHTKTFVVNPELQLTCMVLSKLKDEQFDLHTTESVLDKMDLPEAKDILQEVMKTAQVDSNGKVNFREFMRILTLLPQVPETTAVQNAFNLFNKICTEKVKKEELPDVIKELGITLSEEEFQVALASAAVDESGKLDGTEVMKILSKAPCFSELKAMQDAMKVVENIRNKKMTVTQLEETLDGMGVHIPSTTFNEVVESAKTDENGKIDFQDFLLALGETEEFNEVESLQRAIAIITAIHGSRLNLNELESTLNNLGIYLKPEELQEAMRASHIASDGTVNLRDFLAVLGEMQHFSDSVALHCAIKAFGRIKDEKVEVGELGSVVECLGISVSDTEVEDALKNTPVDESGKVDFKEFLRSMMENERFSGSSAVHDAYGVISEVSDDKIDVSQLEDALAAIGIVLTTEEMREALKNVTVDSDGRVNLKEFMNGLPQTKRFSFTSEMEEAINNLKSIKHDKVNVEELDSILRSMGLHLTPQEIQEMLKLVPKNDDGTVSVRDCMFALTKTRHYSQSEKDKISIENLGSILENMGIDLTKEQMQEALRRIAIDVNGKINLNDFMKVLRGMQHPSFLQGDVISVGDVESLLSGMGINLTQEELEETLKHLTMDENGKVSMSELMKSVTKTRRLLEAERKMIPIEDLNSTLARMGIHLTEKEMMEALKHVTFDADGRVNLKKVLESVLATRRPSKFERERVDIEDIHEILAGLGISLTEEEMREALKRAPLDAEGKMNLGEFMKAVRIVQSQPPTGEMVEIRNLGSTLAKMGIHLTEKEMMEALKHATIDVDGRVNLKEVLESILATRRPSKFERDRVAVEDVSEILASLGISLTEEELQEALKYAPLDAEGKVNLGELMKAVKIIQSQPPTGKMVEIDDLSSTLAKMGINLTENEMKEALKHVTFDADGKVNLKNVLESVMATRRPSSFERDRVAIGDVSEILASLGISLTEEELQEALKYAPLDAEGKVNLGELMKAVRTIQSQPPAAKMVEIDDLSSTLAKMGINLTENEMKEALKHVTFDADGKVNLKNVLESIMATRRPSKFERDRVAVEDVSEILASLGISLTEEEMQEALKHAPLDAEGKVNLGEFMKAVRAIKPQIEMGKTPSDDSLKALGATRKPSLDEQQKIAVQDLASMLASQGIYLNEEELKEALMHVEVNADGTVKLGEFLKGLREVRGLPPIADGKMGWDDLKGARRESQLIPIIIVDDWTKDKKIDIDSLDAILAEMGIHLTNKQLYEALKYAPMDADGKVDLAAFKKGVAFVLKGPQTGKRVDIGVLAFVLTGMGLCLTSTELQEALKLTAANKDGTVDLKDFMWALYELPSIQNKRVDVSNLDTILSAMGIYLAPEELEVVLTRMPLKEDDTVNLKDFIKACSVALDLCSRQGKHLSQMSDATMLKLPKVTEKHHLQSISKLLSSEASAEKTKFKAARSLNQSQLEAFRNAYDLFSKDLDGYIDLPALETTSYNLGISINEDEAFDELMYADTDGDGRVSFTDFLNIITDSKRFDQAVAPKKSDMDTVDARGILFFELLSKLVESCLLPKKATETIVSYYRHKFLESTGKRAWRADSPKQAGKKHGLKKAKSTSVMSKFAGAARICVMKDRELESYMHQLQASIPPSDSPYAKAPIFPLIPNQDGRLPGKPKKDMPKLEKQRRMEPVASFEDHFFQKKRWLQEPQNLKTPKGSLTISPELGKGKRRLTMDNLKEIRLEVKKATDSYRRSIALRERNKSLKLWRRVRGCEVGLEAGNPSFYQTFSTYSWSWNVCQELVTPRELQEYDNKQYQSRSQSITSSDKPIKAGGRQRASIKK